MNDYSKALNSKSLRLIEETIEIYPNCSIDNDILYKYQILFKRIEILRALNVTTKLLLKERSLKFYNEPELVYLHILNNIENKIDFNLFCELPRRKLISYNPWSIMIEFKIYRDRVVQPLKNLHSDLQKYLEETEFLLNQAIDQIERRGTIIIPGKIKIVKDDTLILDKKIIL